MASATEHFDIVLIGSGSVNSFPGPEFAHKSIADIDRGVGSQGAFGGTCLNVGCIPTKMFVHTADVAHTASHADPFNVNADLNAVDFPAVRDRIFGRIDPIASGGEDYRAHHPDNSNLNYLRGTARFVGDKEIEVEEADGNRRITGETFVIGAGSRPVLPPVSGLAEAQPHTSDSIMRIESLPESIAILGSGVIALEFAHVLAALGSTVHLIARSGSLLRHFDRDISRRISEVAQERYTVHFNTAVDQVTRTDDGRVRLQLSGSEPSEIDVAEILVATGRRSNADTLGAAQAGMGMHEDGRIAVDAFQRVLDAQGQVMPGMWAVGDVSSKYQLKHVANRELRIARHNILHPDGLQRSDDLPVPAAVFTHPQVASVGATEDEAAVAAAESGREIKVGRQEFAGIAYGWAMEKRAPGDFAKVITDAESGQILGAHIVGPHAPTLIQQLIQAMSTGQSAYELARGQYWTHPAMPEVIENALLQTV